MNEKITAANGWLELCQSAIVEGLSFTEIPFPQFIKAFKECLPCQVQVNDNPPISVAAIGSIHPLNYSLSYRSSNASGSDGGVLGGGIALEAVRILG